MQAETHESKLNMLGSADPVRIPWPFAYSFRLPYPGSQMRNPKTQIPIGTHVVCLAAGELELELKIIAAGAVSIRYVA